MRIYLRLLVVSLLLFAGNIVYAEAQQEKRVTGTVTSEGEPLPGVSVQLKGASSGTITDIDGNYSIEVPATGTLVFRFVGMRSVEQPVNNRSVINVTLESESKELEEVMVVAYATAKKYSCTQECAEHFLLHCFSSFYSVLFKRTMLVKKATHFSEIRSSNG